MAEQKDAKMEVVKGLDEGDANETLKLKSQEGEIYRTTTTQTNREQRFEADRCRCPHAAPRHADRSWPPTRFQPPLRIRMATLGCCMRATAAMRRSDARDRWGGWRHSARPLSASLRPPLCVSALSSLAEVPKKICMMSELVKVSSGKGGVGGWEAIGAGELSNRR